MADDRSEIEKKCIWKRITLDQLVAAIASLGDRSDKLKKETWKLNVKTRENGSVWGELIELLQLDHTESTRRSLYSIWCRDRHQIKFLVDNKKAAILENEHDTNDDSADRTESHSVPAENNSSLHSDPSLLVPDRPKRRAVNQQNTDGVESIAPVVTEASIVFSASEWKDVFSRTDQKMKPDWSDIFQVKLTSSGFDCSVKFKSPYIKKGKRKHECRFCCCHATCTISECPRKFEIVLKKTPDKTTSVLFLVRITGQEKHDVAIATSSRQCRGKRRFLVGSYCHSLIKKTFPIYMLCHLRKTSQRNRSCRSFSRAYQEC